MIKQFLLLISICCITFSINAQEKVIELEDSFSFPREIPKQSYSVPNQINGELGIVFQEKKRLKAYLFDANHQIKSHILTKTLPKKYNDLIGYTIYEDLYAIFFSNAKKTKFGVLQLDFNNQKTEVVYLKEFNLSGEKFIEAINYKNQIHVLASKNNSSDIYIYKFNKDLSNEKTLVSLKEVEFESKSMPGVMTKASQLFKQGAKELFNSTVQISKIDHHYPSTLETTSKKLKLYQQDNIAVLGFDHNIEETKLCYLNLEDYSTSFKTFDKPSKKEEGFKKSNSFLYKDELFQIASSSSKMKFIVSNVTSGEIIKEYAINKKDSITFKNSPIIQEGSMTFFGFSEDQTREMEKTTKFLRKISQGNLGISVAKGEKGYNIILGGIQEIRTGSGAGFGSGFGSGFGTSVSSGVPVYFNVGFNPASMEYGRYTSSKQTYIKCLFDTNMEHLQGKFETNSFDRLRKFERKISYFMAKNIFTHKGKLYYGLFHTKDKVYRLYQFEK
ncbi:hypothetical protein [uncultured Aquimarina sp.]|uniref:hypothetical protein n=1 Tax=uncultured Aquimarina sp. TaxID=575652 RepID=UPI002618C8F0|nr:hypothetical protein [uncultured Aquimarina sp.]